MEIYFPFLKTVWLNTDTFYLKLSPFQSLEHLTLFSFPVELTNIFFQKLSSTITDIYRKYFEFEYNLKYSFHVILYKILKPSKIVTISWPTDR